MSETGQFVKTETDAAPTDDIQYVHVEYPPERRPYCCPVCYGKGMVPAGFYGSVGATSSVYSTAPETCRSCGGTGYVVV